MINNQLKQIEREFAHVLIYLAHVVESNNFVIQKWSQFQVFYKHLSYKKVENIVFKN